MTRTFLWLLFCLATCACSSHRLRCDGALQPINPSPGAQAGQGHAGTTGEVPP